MQDVIWIGNKAKVITITPQWKIDSAINTIKQALSGELKFDLSQFFPVKEYKIRKHLIDKWKANNKYDNMHDSVTMRKWRSNLNQIRNACKLLYREGILNGWHVDGSGRLSVSWFTAHTPKFQGIVEFSTYAPASLPRVDEFAHERNAYEEAQRDDCIPTREPENKKLWYILMTRKGDECILDRMDLRAGYGDQLAIILRAYLEYDLDTLHTYDAPLSCPIEDHREIWEMLEEE